MMGNKLDKTKEWTVLFLMVVCCGLLLYGVLGREYCWFTGPKLTVLLTLGSMYGRVAAAQHNPIASFLVYGGAGTSLLAGMHLFIPYFWAVRIHHLSLLGAFALTAGILWLFLLSELHKLHYFGKVYHFYCYLPLVMLIGVIIPQRVSFGGELYASSLLSLFYTVLAYLLLAKGVSEINRWYFNVGLLLLGSVIIGLCLTFLFDFPTKNYFIGAAVIMVALNLLFFTLEKRGKNE